MTLGTIGLALAISAAHWFAAFAYGFVGVAAFWGVCGVAVLALCVCDKMKGGAK